jgi:hypothetical protein
MAKILISIPKRGGKIKLEVEGVAGDSCTLLTQPYEARLGGKVAEQDLKPEYYDREVETEREYEVN